MMVLAVIATMVFLQIVIFFTIKVSGRMRCLVTAFWGILTLVPISAGTWGTVFGVFQFVTIGSAYSIYKEGGTQREIDRNAHKILKKEERKRLREELYLKLREVCYLKAVNFSKRLAEVLVLCVLVGILSNICFPEEFKEFLKFLDQTILAA
jgi:hypothetical protein